MVSRLLIIATPVERIQNETKLINPFWPSRIIRIKYIINGGSATIPIIKKKADKKSIAPAKFIPINDFKNNITEQVMINPAGIDTFAPTTNNIKAENKSIMPKNIINYL